MHDKISKFFKIIAGTKEPAYDVETNGLKWQVCHTVGYSVSDGTDNVYIPTRHTGGGNIDQPEQFEKDLAKTISEHTGKIIGHNIKFDNHFSQNHGIYLGNRQVDTMVQEALLDENRRSYSLENVSKSYNIAPKLGKVLYEHIGRSFNVKPDRSSMGHYHRLAGDDPLAVEYAEGDTFTTKQLYEAQKKKLYEQQLDLVSDLENQLCYVLQKMERRGIKVDLEEAEKVKLEVDKLYEEAYLQLPLSETTDGDIKFLNIRSGKDLKEYFEMCDITDWPTTLPSDRFPDGQPSFNKTFLAGSQEGLNILNARKYSHLKNSFLDVLDSHIYKGHIHTTFNQTMGETHGTKTGRLSSSNPNKQQVPKRDEELGKIYRRMFVANADCFLIEYDYSQAEPRLYAHYSGEPALVQGYSSIPVIDMHKITADMMGIPRSVAKNINLGIMYTMGAEKLASQLGCSLEQAKDYLRKWRRLFPRVSNYDKRNPGFTQRAAQVAEERGYVKTILGRRARFPDPRWSYRAANRIIQGSSADIMKWKLVEINKYLEDNRLEDVCKMLLTIHDSIVFEIHKSREDLVSIIEGLMTRVSGPPFNLKIPMTVDYHRGENWSVATYGQ